MPSTKRKRSPKPPPPTSALILELPENNLVYGPEYSFVHLDNNPTLRKPSLPPFRSLTFVEEYRAGIEIVHSCNGLLLCRTSRVSDLRTAYYVFNPATGEHRTVLPRPKVRSGTKNTETPSIFRIALAFEPSVSPHYKVVCVKGLADRALRQDFWIEIYSSETCAWTRSTAGVFAAEFNARFESGVYSNGSVHWLNSWSRSLYFIVAEERVRELPMPMPLSMPATRMRAGVRNVVSYFGESLGSLHLIYREFEPGTVCLVVFDMEEDYSGWAVKYRVDLGVVSAAVPEVVRRNSVVCRVSLLCVIRGDEDEDEDEDEGGSYLVMYVPGKVLRYNLKSGTCYKLCDVEPMECRGKSWSWPEPKAYRYVESLIASV